MVDHAAHPRPLRSRGRGAVSLSDAEAKRMLASMQTKEAAMLEAQFHADHAAGLHDQMLKISDDFFSARASAGTPREQALRASFHGDGFYHTLFDVAETLKDYAFLETEVKHAHAQAALELGAPPSAPQAEERGLISKRVPSELIEMEAQWGWAKKQAKKAEQRVKAAARKAEQHAKAVKRAAEEATKKAAAAAVLRQMLQRASARRRERPARQQRRSVI